jgi:hypothetical protein
MADSRVAFEKLLYANIARGLSHEIEMGLKRQ